MELLEAIKPLLRGNQEKEIQQLLYDYHNLTAYDFFKSHKKSIGRYWDEDDFIESQNESYDLSSWLIVMYLVEAKYVLSVDWSGEEYPGQIKRFLHARLKHYGHTDIKLNDKIAKKKLDNNEVRRGEWIPLLLHCFDSQVMPLGLKIAILSLGDDEYNIFLVPNDWFEQMENLKISEYGKIIDAKDWHVDFDEIVNNIKSRSTATDTSFSPEKTKGEWELSIVSISENKSAVMILLRKKFNIALSEIKNFISTVPVFLGRGSEKQLLELKNEFEQIGCVMLLKKCDK